MERHRLRRLAIEERTVEDVDRRRTVEEVELAVLRLAVALLVRHLGVLDHAIGLAELHGHPNLLVGIALRAELERILRLLLDVIADERGIGDLDERIVHLEEEHRLDAALLHVRERAGLLQRREESAVTVGGHEDVPGLIEDDLTVLRHPRPHALGEEEDVVGVESEVLVLLEALHGRLVIRLRRHHVERNRRAVADRAREDLARVEVEERRAGNRSDRVAALRSVVAEARALSARDQQCRDAPGLQLLLARGNRLLERGALQLGDFRRLAVLIFRFLPTPILYTYT